MTVATRRAFSEVVISRQLFMSMIDMLCVVALYNMSEDVEFSSVRIYLTKLGNYIEGMKQSRSTRDCEDELWHA